MKSQTIKIRPAGDDDLSVIFEIINDAASAYKGVIPDSCWHNPYMSMDELKEQIAGGVNFECFDIDGNTVGVMGLQDKFDVCLVRHAYVRTLERGKGIGSALLKYLYEKTEKPVLIGTWRDACWAVNFYLKNGFVLVDENLKAALLKKYWNVSAVQSENSVVLADKRWCDKTE